MRADEKDRPRRYHVTAALIWKNGRVLIARRPKGAHLEGLWEFPGGKREAGESLETCLERELAEELGIAAKVDAHRVTVRHDYERKRITLHVFSCRLLKGKPRPIQCQEVRWVSPSELRLHAFPPPDRRVIELLFGGGREEGEVHPS